jgi:hypothetical protein
LEVTSRIAKPNVLRFRNNAVPFYHENPGLGWQTVGQCCLQQKATTILIPRGIIVWCFPPEGAIETGLVIDVRNDDPRDVVIEAQECALLLEAEDTSNAMLRAATTGKQTKIFLLSTAILLSNGAVESGNSLRSISEALFMLTIAHSCGPAFQIAVFMSATGPAPGKGISITC